MLSAVYTLFFFGGGEMEVKWKKAVNVIQAALYLKTALTYSQQLFHFFLLTQSQTVKLY